MKVCSKCKIKKEDNNFCKYKKGLQNYCKICNKEYRKIYIRGEKHKEWQKQYRRRDYVRGQMSVYHKEYIKKWHKDKMLNDPEYRLARLLRKRLWRAIQGDYKSGSAVKDLGCSVLELKKYLEKQFKTGMSWKNYGLWHIDHIIPLIKFDLTDRSQLLKAVNFSNLQPLWAVENLTKNKY